MASLVARSDGRRLLFLDAMVFWGCLNDRHHFVIDLVRRGLLLRNHFGQSRCVRLSLRLKALDASSLTTSVDRDRRLYSFGRQTAETWVWKLIALRVQVGIWLFCRLVLIAMDFLNYCCGYGRILYLNLLHALLAAVAWDRLKLFFF